MSSETSHINELRGFIAEFPADFYDDYCSFKDLMTRCDYPGSTSHVTDIACGLRKTLYSWGAGKRKAPAVKSVEEVAKALARSEFRRNLSYLSENYKIEVPVKDKRKYMDLLFKVLTEISEIFIPNTQMTYPTKALLLLWSGLPALDSNVCTALPRMTKIAPNSLRGLYKKSLPTNSNQRVFQIYAGLTWELSGFWNEYGDDCRKAGMESFKGFNNLESGRIMDILLFSVGAKINKKKNNCAGQ